MLEAELSGKRVCGISFVNDNSFDSTFADVDIDVELWISFIQSILNLAELLINEIFGVSTFISSSSWWGWSSLFYRIITDWRSSLWGSSRWGLSWWSSSNWACLSPCKFSSSPKPSSLSAVRAPFGHLLCLGCLFSSLGVPPSSCSSSFDLAKHLSAFWNSSIYGGGKL